MPAEPGCKILAGIETAVKGDPGNRFLWIAAQESGGQFESTSNQVLPGTQVHDRATAPREGGCSHSAMTGHLLERPFLPAGAGLVPQFGEEHLNRAVVARQIPVLRAALRAEGFQQIKQQMVDVQRHARDRFLPVESFNTGGDRPEILAEGRRALPHRVFVQAQLTTEFLLLLRREHDPIRPRPGLVRTTDADVKEYPVKPSRSEIRIAQTVQVPRACDGQVSGVELVPALPEAEHHAPGLEANDFDAFIAVRLKSPVLFSARVEKADAADARQDAVRNTDTGIVTMRQGAEPDLSFGNGLSLRAGGIHPEHASLRPEGQF